MTAAEVTEIKLAELVDRFYAKVRQDPMIGVLFNGAIEDWPAHLNKLTAFWSSVMLTTGRYKGNPMAAHNKHAAEIALPMFDRWLALWRETTAEVFAPSIAADLQAKAERIARSLKMGLEFHAASTPQHPRPYKSTPVFDEITLPNALRKEHRTKSGVWGVIRVHEGEVRLHFADHPQSRLLSSFRPGFVEPEQTHWVEPVGKIKMQVEFYDTAPAVS